MLVLPRLPEEEWVRERAAEGVAEVVLGTVRVAPPMPLAVKGIVGVEVGEGDTLGVLAALLLLLGLLDRAALPVCAAVRVMGV